MQATEEERKENKFSVNIRRERVEFQQIQGLLFCYHWIAAGKPKGYEGVLGKSPCPL
jgi:hypothetical protein